MLIGLAGSARVGKDTVGDILRKEHGFQTRAFADLMRAAALAIDPIVTYDRHSDLLVRYSEVLQAVGYERAKDVVEIRRFLQRLGTEMGRKLFNEDFWVDLTFNQVTPFGRHLAITDVRFPNEAHAIKQRGGTVVLIERPGYGPANTHASETSLLGWKFDFYINNEGTIAQLHPQVEELLTWAG